MEIGPIRLVGVGFSGLSDSRQESLFPDLDQTDEILDSHREAGAAVEATPAGWRIGDDVAHPDHGHGWVQGAGHGVMTVRFETRASGPGPARTFPDDTPGFSRADPVASLDWGDYLGGLADYQSTP